jgi:hypothetical protein
MNNVQDVIDFAIDNAEIRHDVEVRSYSGRGMFGEECLAITGSFRDCLATVVMAATLDPEVFYSSNLLRVIRDGMGLNEVWYWPHIPWGDE